MQWTEQVDGLRLLYFLKSEYRRNTFTPIFMLFRFILWSSQKSYWDSQFSFLVTLECREYLMYYRGQAFLAIEWFGSFSHPLSASSTGDTQEGWKRETTCWWERGKRWREEPNHTTTRKPGPLYTLKTVCFGWASLPPVTLLSCSYFT